MSDAARAARIAHALRYPFDPPGRSYLFRDGTMQPLDAFDPAGRHAVVASGSNGSPDRLREKFGDTATIPVTFGHLHGLVPVFAARITSYGSVPATLAPIPGRRAGVHITWLTDAQIEVMHVTEAVGRGYGWYRLDGFALDHEPWPQPAEMFAYIALHGALAPGGALLPLEDVSQHEAQGHVQRAHGNDGHLHDFVDRNLTDRDYRAGANESAARLAVEVAHPGLVRLI
ncbi:MAG: hypothetical protein VYB54_11515 [Pseudomonadota bacterium]|nr:hypothetical protein [Pseudomonadota bacterium]